MNGLSRIIEFGFYLFIFLLPWQTRLIWFDPVLNGYTWEYGRFSLYGTEILLWLILLLYAFWLFKQRHLQRLSFSQFWQRLKSPAVLSYWLLIIFILLAGLSVLWSLNAQLAYYNWFHLLEAAAMFSLIILFGLKLKKIAIVWVASAAVQGVIAVWQFFSQYIAANKWLGLAEHYPNLAGSIILQTNIERWLRAYGSLPHPNILAGFLVVALFLLLYLAFEANNRRFRLFVLGSLVCIFPALFFTFSRSAWVALIVGLIILSFWLYRRKQYFWNQTFIKIFFLMVLMAMILGLNLSGPLVTRITGEQELEVASIYLRLEFNQQAWQLIQLRPWQGVGIGNYTLGVFQNVNALWPGYYYQPVHNLYLLLWAELGLFGLLLAAAPIIILLWFCARRAASLEGVVVFLCLFSVLIIGLFDHYFWTLYFGVMIFWLVLALNIRQLKQPDTS